MRVASGRIYPVWNVTLEVKSGELTAVVGESGSGKTSLAWAAMGRPLPGQMVESGKVYFKNQELLSLPLARRREIYFKELSFVPQNAAAALHPTQTVFRSLKEVYRPSNGKDLREAVLPLLGALGLPAEVLFKYPHQLSGGQKQRLALVVALCNSPQMLILDEPTSSLDAWTQQKVKDVLSKFQEERGASILFFTHDINLAASFARRIVVFYAGQIVEDLPGGEIARARHPYTCGLVAASPRIGDPPRSRRGIPGYCLPLSAPPQACSFAARCGEAAAVCRQKLPPLTAVESGRVRCFLYAS